LQCPDEHVPVRLQWVFFVRVIAQRVPHAATDASTHASANAGTDTSSDAGTHTGAYSGAHAGTYAGTLSSSYTCTHMGVHARSNVGADSSGSLMPGDLLSEDMQLLGPAGVQLQCPDEHVPVRLQWVFFVRVIAQRVPHAATDASTHASAHACTYTSTDFGVGLLSGNLLQQ